MFFGQCKILPGEGSRVEIIKVCCLAILKGHNNYAE